MPIGNTNYEILDDDRLVGDAVFYKDGQLQTGNGSPVSGGGAGVVVGDGVTPAWSAADHGLERLTPSTCTLTLTTIDGVPAVRLDGTTVGANMYVDIDCSAENLSYFGGAFAECWTDTSKTANIGVMMSADTAFAAYAQGGFAPTAWVENNCLVSNTIQKFIVEWFPGGSAADIQFSPGYQGTWATTPPTFPVGISKIRVRFTAKAGFAPVAYLTKVGPTGGRKSRVVVSIDDGNSSAFRHLKPVFDKRNIKCTWAIITDQIGNPGYMTRAQLQTLFNQGHELIPHGPLVTGLSGDVINNYIGSADPVAAAMADINTHRSNLAAWGLVRGESNNVYAWPRGAHARYIDDAAYDNAIKGIGIKLARSASVTPYSFVASQWPNQMMLPIIGHSQGTSLANEQANIATIVNRINDAASRGTDVIVMFHQGADPSYNTWNTPTYIRSDHLDTICAAIQANVRAGSQESVLFSGLLV